MPQPNEIPLLKFKSYTQGKKAIAFIQTEEELDNLNNFQEKINLQNKTEIFTGPGRMLGEHTFIELKKGIPVSFGFYEWHTQIQSAKKRDLLKIIIPQASATLINELQLSILKNDFTSYYRLNDKV
jgi:DNA polymerase-3 subunit epsilon